MSLERVTTDAPGLTVAVTSPLRHRCPHVEEEDHGTVTITWRVQSATLELHALRRYLQSFEEEKVSHEELTARIAREVRRVSGLTLVSVQSSWETAGQKVSCFIAGKAD